LKNVMIKVAFGIRIAGYDRHMPHLCKHELLRWDFEMRLS
jgi:hypothetical protein